MSRNRNKDRIITEQAGNKGTVIDIDKLYIYVNHLRTGVRFAYDYTGLKRWLTNFIQDVSGKNLTLSCNSNSKLLIPKGNWVKGIRAKGSATGITITFNGKPYPISSCANGHEIQPRTQYVASDIDLTVTATSWGKLDIIVFI